MELNCKDCTFYLPVDVFHGICKISKAKILPDDAFCQDAVKLQKCKFCLHFTEEKEFLGKCMGRSLAYPDMIASKCENFEWVQKN